MRTPEISASRLPILIVTAVALSTVLVMGVFVAHDRWLFALIAAALAVLWLMGWRQNWSTAIDLGFVGTVGLGALGVIVSASGPTAMLMALLVLAATVSALAAWDLMRFDGRLRRLAPGRRGFAPKTAEALAPQDVQLDIQFEWRHQRRVLVTAGIGFAVGLLAILVRMQLAFASIALVLLLALVLFALSLRELRADA